MIHRVEAGRALDGDEGSRVEQVEREYVGYGEVHRVIFLPTERLS